MNTNNKGREDISALMDNELSDEQVAAMLGALQHDELEAWDVYHQVGDVLRSDDMGHAFSPDFASRMAARLDAEPVVLAPVTRSSPAEKTGLRRWALPAAAVAAVALVALLNPRVVSTQDSADGPAVVQLQHFSNVALNEPSRTASSRDGEIVQERTQDGVMLRDPRIDEYLSAHQRVSPSLYSTAQYARPASFASESDR